MGGAQADTTFPDAYEDNLKGLAKAIAGSDATEVAGSAAALLVKVLTGSSILAGAAEKAAARTFGEWFANTADARLHRAALEFAAADRERDRLRAFGVLVEARVREGLVSVNATLERLRDGQGMLAVQITEQFGGLTESMWTALHGIGQLKASGEELQALVARVAELVGDLQRTAPSGVRSSRPPARPIFVAYSHKDVEHLHQLKTAARRLEASGLVSLWHDEEVKPGEPWAERVREKLEGARLVVGLMSPDFLASPWCVSELGRAFELRDRRLLDVVPVVVRQCGWRDTRLGAIQALPAGGAPLESFPDGAAAWDDIVASLERLLRGERMEAAIPSRDSLLRSCAESLEADQRLMLLAPWRAGLEELGQEIARRTHGDNVTTLRLPVVETMDSARFYADLSGDESVTTAQHFRLWLMRRCVTVSGRASHLVVLPYFGGPQLLVKELGVVLRGVFEETGALSLLVLGRHRCAALLKEVQSASLFSGIVKEHVSGMDLDEAGTLLQRLGADPAYAPHTHQATGAHPEWLRLCAPEVRQGRLDGLPQHLADKKLFGILRDRLIDFEAGRQGVAHAATTLERLLHGQAVVRLSDASDDLGYPEVRLYYDGILIERDARTLFRCEAARIAAERAHEVWIRRQ
jgi:hypothetical protein